MRGRKRRFGTIGSTSILPIVAGAVAILIVVSAMLALMTFGSYEIPPTPTVALEPIKTSTGNYVVKVLSITKSDVKPGDVTVLASPNDGEIVGQLICDGTFVQAGDHVTISGLWANHTYTITFRYNPQGTAMGQIAISTFIEG